MNEKILQLKKMLLEIPVNINEKDFLFIMGGLFLLGIVTKWVVMLSYGKLIKRAENMSHPKGKTLRQIKMKFESIKEVNGHVSNPMLLVRRHLNKCKVGYFSLKRLDGIINYCIVIILLIAGGVGLKLYFEKVDSFQIMGYILTGCFFAFVLGMINNSVMIKDRQMELTYIIVDFLENDAMARKEKHMDTLIDLVQEEEEKAESKSDEESKEEVIVNQVIGEFLQ